MNGSDRASIRSACPTNRQIGRELDSITLKALLAVPLTAVSSQVPYRFCSDRACPTVYYRTDGQQVFGETDLRERVYQKHPDEPATVVCYCFDITVGEIRDVVERSAQSALVARITGGIRAGQCACDIRNPQGTCCLNNVRTLLEPVAKC